MEILVTGDSTVYSPGRVPPPPSASDGIPRQTEARVPRARHSGACCPPFPVWVWAFCCTVERSSLKRRSWQRGNSLSPLRSKIILFIYFSLLWVSKTGRLIPLCLFRVLSLLQHFFPDSLQWTFLVMILVQSLNIFQCLKFKGHFCNPNVHKIVD